MDSKTQFQEEVRTALARLTDQLISVLTRLIISPYPPEVKSLDFEIFCDGFTYKFPVRVFFMDEDNSEFFVFKDGRAAYPSDVDPDLLDIEQVYSAELEDKYSQLDENLDIYTAASEALIPWFADCWKAAGGLQFSLQARIALHDNITAFNLVHQTWEKMY